MVEKKCVGFPVWWINFSWRKTKKNLRHFTNVSLTKKIQLRNWTETKTVTGKRLHKLEKPQNDQSKKFNGQMWIGGSMSMEMDEINFSLKDKVFVLVLFNLD